VHPATGPPCCWISPGRAGRRVIVPAVAATITAYNVGLFIHILAVVLAFGPTFAYGFFVGFADSKAPAAVPAVNRVILMINLYLVTPAMIVVLAAGFYLLSEGDIDASESWVQVGFVAIVALFALVHGFFNPRTRRAIELSERDLAAGGELSAEYRGISAQMARVGQLAGLVVVVAIFFMVVKP
jgi:Na+/proline symporter